MKAAIAIAAIIAAFAFAGADDIETAQIVEDEYCARVAAGAHTDYDDLCQAGHFNSFAGEAGDVACVGDGSCTDIASTY